MEKKIISSLEQNRGVFQKIFENTPEPEYRWREREGKWNLLEVVCHLYDEEKEDFRARIKSVLENPENHLVPIDPEGWVTERNYSAQSFEDMLEKFLKERDFSISWLKSLTGANWESTYSHPKLGSLSAKLFLSNWLAHDYLHIRQITRIRYHYLQYYSGQKLDYAGNW